MGEEAGGEGEAGGGSGALTASRVDFHAVEGIPTPPPPPGGRTTPPAPGRPLSLMMGCNTSQF